MNTNKFFEAFTELDDELIENAVPQTNELEIARPAERICLWKPFAAAAAAVAVVCGIAVGMKIYGTSRHVASPSDSVSEDDKSQTGNSAALNSGNNANYLAYSYITINERVFFSARELAGNCDFAVTGKVTGISFELHDKYTGELLTEYSGDAHLCTVYDVDVMKSYKGDVRKNVRIIMYNGLEGYRIDEQTDLMGRAAGRGIPVLENPVDISIGEEYLFMLSQSTSQSGTGGAMTCLLNHSQGFFRTDQPTVKERFSNASLNDIVDCLTNTVDDNHSEEVSVIHNAQHVPLSDQQSTALTDMVLQTVTTECLPDAQLNTVLSEQHIEEYSQNGYVIAIQYDDFNAPTYAYGDSSDKKARGICHITVLIGEEGKPSYITYSYIVGGSEHQDGGTYFLGSGSRERLLQILENHDNEHDNNDHNSSNHNSEHDNTDHNNEHENNTHETEHHNEPDVISTAHHAHN